MGIIIKQTIKGTIYSYLGILIGFLAVNFIQPNSLTPAQVGLLGILTNFSMMFAQFAILGFNGTARYFPYFRSEEKKHHGYLFLACMVSLLGIILFVVLAYFFKDDIITERWKYVPPGHQPIKNLLFEKYYWYLVPLTFFTLFFNVFDLYARMLYNITTGLILREFTKRVFVLLTVLLVYFKLVKFDSFMELWLVANIIPTAQIIFRLIKNKQFFWRPDFKFLDRNLSIKLISICFFTILTGSSPIIIQNIDTYFVLKNFGLGAVGIYTIAFYFATIIALPSRSLYSIAYTVISEAWKVNDLENIKTVYTKSCINQIIGALFIFILIWANIDNIFQVLPPAYKGGKYVVFFVSIGLLIDSATGVNGVILSSSKYFKYDALFNLLLVGVTIVSNIILIPIYGFTGAAMAVTITFFIFNLFRYIFILVAYKMQPFKIQSLLAVVTGVLVYYLSVWIIPHMQNFIVDTIVRTAFITVLYLPAVYYMKLSDDINIIINNLILKLKG